MMGECKGEKDMSENKRVAGIREKFRRRAERLAVTGLVLQGTITERVITRNRRKDGEAARSFGPYYQWTFKQAGKTVTVNLTFEQAQLVRDAIENNRKAEKSLEEMRRISWQLLEATTSGVKRRKQARMKDVLS